MHAETLGPRKQPCLRLRHRAPPGGLFFAPARLLQIGRSADRAESTRPLGFGRSRPFSSCPPPRRRRRFRFLRGRGGAYKQPAADERRRRARCLRKFELPFTRAVPRRFTRAKIRRCRAAGNRVPFIAVRPRHCAIFFETRLRCRLNVCCPPFVPFLLFSATLRGETVASGFCY